MPALIVLAALLGLVAAHGRASRWSAAGEPPRRAGTPEERLQWLSTHEAGHAIAARYCPLVGQILGVAIEPTTEGGALWRGKVTHDWLVGPDDRGRLWWDTVISLAGLAAETACYGEIRTLLMRDVDDALARVRALCRSGDCLPDPVRAPVPLAVRCTPAESAVLSHAWEAACGLLSAHAAEHAAVSQALASKRSLGPDELSRMVA